MGAATNPAVPALLKYIFDTLTAGNQAGIPLALFLFLFLYAVRGSAHYIIAVASGWVEHKVVMVLRQEMFAVLLRLPSHSYDQSSTGNMVSKFTYDVRQTMESGLQAVISIVYDSCAILGLLGWLFYIDWQLTLVSLVSTPFIVATVLVARQRLRKMSRKVQDSMAGINRVLEECIRGHKLVKLFSAGRREHNRFEEVADANRSYSMKFTKAAATVGPIVELITSLVLALIIYIAMYKNIAGNLDLSALISFFAAVMIMARPVKRLSTVGQHLQKALAACESVFQFLDQTVETDTGRQVLAKTKGKITFNGVSFGYRSDDKNVLQNISFHIDPGETVALVGVSGSGKSTIANLIPMLYRAERGEISLDGHNIRNVSLKSLRNNIALVSQDVMLFNDTVRNNIAYGCLHGADDKEILAAAEAAHALEFISELPEGFDTLIGEYGVKLSGGQRQRLAIARALLSDAPVLIMDEATSSLDSVAERQIQAALEALRKGHTCLIIAHRLSTIETADRILVVERGRIVESGDHEELIQASGVYAKLHRLQFNI